MGFLETVGGASYLTELTNYLPTALHVNEYAEIVAQKALRRCLIKASQDIVGYGYDETVNLQDLIENAESRLFEVSQRHVKQDVTSLESILTESFDRLDAEELATNSKAVMEAVFGVKSAFVRTPKFRVTKKGEKSQANKYRKRLVLAPWIEMVIGADSSLWRPSTPSPTTTSSPAPFLILFVVGYWYTGR